MNVVFLAYDLEKIEKEIWQLLEQSAQSHKAPFHSGVVATAEDGLPQMRTVILRRAEAEVGKLYFHTDVRSPKVMQLKQEPRMSWLFYNAELRVQLRLQATAVVHYDDEVANHGWEHSRLASRLCYTTSSAAGTLLATPELINVNRTEVEPELIEIAWKNFCVIETVVQKMDWVFLNKEGNRRALFDYSSNNYQWIQV